MRQVSPPKMMSSSHCFIVSVPATTRAYRDGIYVQDGYGGAEALIIFEGLSEQYLGDLGTLFAQDGEETRSIHDLILCPHSAGTPPLVTLEAELNLFFVRRNLRRLLVRYLEMNAQVQQLGDDAVNRNLQLLDANTQLHNDVQFLNDIGEQEAARVEREAARERATLEEDFRRLADDHLEETQDLNPRAVGLEAELNQAGRKIETLETAAQETSFDADKLKAFLNDGSTELRGNWPRLRQLLKHFEERTQPPPSWKTWLQTEAVDEPYRTYPPYGPPTPKGDDQGDDRGSDQEGKSEDRPPHEARSRLLVMVRRLACPTDHKHGQVWCRSATKPLERTVDEALKSLPEFTAWQDIQPDVQMVLRVGLDYPEAL
ncbi:unnamed protein product [Phytophthora fragariaefolia]|uniref:Unnamed protein product n=1 Tax=Phytophthora fragariaefolia TaxID=1490495 RepID=A0A9W6XY37_9STRA|nr:unnamed protein product [Phytophthora fragariaefolia]